MLLTSLLSSFHPSILIAINGLNSVREAEAMGVREAMSWTKQKEWQWVILETDAQVVTRAVADGINITPFGAIVNEIRTYLQHLPSVKFDFVKRNGNMSTHILAMKAFM